MIALPDPFVVQRRESLCSRVNGGGMPTVGADPSGRVLPGENVVHADAHKPRQPEGQDGRGRPLGRRDVDVQRFGDVEPTAHAGSQEPRSRPHVHRFLRAQGEVHDATASVRVPENVGSTPSWCIA